jgi:hypothetical protein
MRRLSRNRVLAGGFMLSLLPTVLASGLAAGRAQRNPVAHYLSGAELQCEGDAQRENIVSALNDALTMPGASLAAKRYKDYQGQEGQWDLPTLLYRHFVPKQPGATLGNHFYRDVKAKAAQEVIQEVIRLIVQRRMC